MMHSEVYEGVQNYIFIFFSFVLTQSNGFVTEILACIFPWFPLGDLTTFTMNAYLASRNINNHVIAGEG